jgi:DNA-binding winged helix-turn-helix (wHTH) protein/TolB-like protein
MATVRFGQFELDPGTGTLQRDGVPVRLHPQPARILVMLVARPGDIVRRDELREAIWGTETFVDFERGLNFCIAQIRSALGDSAESPRYIETLPKRGYRFIAPVRDVAPAAVAVEANSAPAPDVPSAAQPPDITRGRSRVVAALAAVVVLAGAGVWYSRAGGQVSPVRVAVVPFDNETGSTDFDRIAGGVADATVARLATPERLGRVAVIGNAAVLRRPRAFRDLKAIGQELNADYVILAQVKSDGGRVRLIAHLIRVRDEAHVWAHTFDRDDFSLAAQSELAEAIAAAVVKALIAA